MHKHFVTLQQQILSYQAFGQGPTLCILHGWGANMQQWQAVAKFLSSWYHVVWLDFPGFGQSPEPIVPIGVPQYANYTHALMQHLGHTYYAICGHSFGGRVALDIAYRHPTAIARLVLIAPGGSYLTHCSVYLKRWLAYFGRPMIPFIPMILRRLLWSTDARCASSACMQQTLRLVLQHDVRPFLPHITCPTAIVWGSEDALNCNATVYDALPNSTRHILWQANHHPHQSHPEDFCNLLKTILAT
jgi:pimeloyl-ACP methyl ester carboxylesterase